MLAEWIYFCKQHPDQVIDMFSPPETNLLSVPLKRNMLWPLGSHPPFFWPHGLLLHVFELHHRHMQLSTLLCQAAFPQLHICEFSMKLQMLWFIPFHFFVVIHWMSIQWFLGLFFVYCWWNIWIVSRLRLLQIIWLWKFLYRNFLCVHVYISVQYVPLTFWFTGLTYIQLQ